MAWKPILIAAVATLLVAACGGNDNPPAGKGSNGSASASDTRSADASDSAVADAPTSDNDYIGQPEPSANADDDHPQTQWKSKMFAGGDVRN